MISASPRRRAPRVPCHVPTHLRPWAYTCVLLNLLPSCLWARSPAATDPALHYDNAELRTPLARLLDSLLNPHDVTDPSAAPEMGGGGEETPEPSRLRRSARHPPRANPAMPTEPYLQWPRQPSPNDATAQLTRYLTTTTVPTPLAPDPMGDATCECATLDPHRRTPLARRCLRDEHSAAQRGGKPPLRYECTSRTCAYDDCANRRIARSDFPPLHIRATPDRGKGLYATCALPPDTIVGPYYGTLIRETDKHQLEQHWAHAHGGDGSARTAYCLNMSRHAPVASDQIICDAYEHGSTMRFMNHSCEPNCELDYIAIDRAQPPAKARWETVAILTTTRDILPSEELTFNYFGVRPGGDRTTACAEAARTEARRWGGCSCRSPKCFMPRRTLPSATTTHPPTPPPTYLPALLQAARQHPPHAYYTNFSQARWETIPIISEPGFPGLDLVKRPGNNRPSPFLSSTHMRLLLDYLSQLLNCGTPLKPASSLFKWWMADPALIHSPIDSPPWKNFFLSPQDTNLLIPVHIGSTHYMMLAADLCQGHCSLVDSLHHESTYPTTHPITRENVHVALKHALGIIHELALARGFPAHAWQYSHVPCPQQPLLSNDCVIFTAYNMYCYALGAPLCTAAQADALRSLWLPALFGCNPRQVTPTRGRPIPKIPLAYGWTHASTLYAFQQWCRAQSPPAARPAPTPICPSVPPPTARTAQDAPNTSLGPTSSNRPLPPPPPTNPMLSAPPSPGGAHSPPASLAQSESSDEEMPDELLAPPPPLDLSALDSLAAIQIPDHAPAPIAPIDMNDFTALLEFLAPRSTSDPTYISPHKVWVAPPSLVLPPQPSEYSTAYATWRADLPPEVIAAAKLSTRALFALQELAGCWLLLGVDRTDAQRPFVFAIDPKLSHTERMRSILLDEFALLWNLPRDTWTELELLHPSPALARNTGAHTLFNLVSALRPSHINGWCTRDFGETTIQRWLSFFLHTTRNPPTALSPAFHTAATLRTHFLDWVHSWHLYAGDSLALTRAENFFNPSPRTQPGSRFAIRYWAQYSDSAHPHIGTSTALNRERTTRRLILLRTLPDYFPAAPHSLPLSPYTTARLHRALTLLAPLWGWSVDALSQSAHGWLAPTDLSFESLPVITHSGTDLYGARLAQWHTTLHLPASGLLHSDRIALCCRATQGEWCLFIADRTTHRAALIDPSGARHPCIADALFQWLGTLWGPSNAWLPASQWATVHYHPVPLTDSAPLTIFNLGMWLSGHVGAWALPEMAPALHQWLTHLTAPASPPLAPDSLDSQERHACDGPLTFFDEWILVGPRSHYLRPLALKLKRGTRPIASYTHSLPTPTPLRDTVIADLSLRFAALDPLSRRTPPPPSASSPRWHCYLLGYLPALHYHHHEHGPRRIPLPN